MGILGLCYLATICNSMIIEMCDDMIRVSHGFRGCQMLNFIARLSKKSKNGKFAIFACYKINNLQAAN
jgi:hypothetical protein